MNKTGVFRRTWNPLGGTRRWNVFVHLWSRPERGRTEVLL